MGFSTAMNAADRSIRVFVSSTFQDMHGERDHLVKFVFPSLRSLCRSRGVAFSEIDLRWGITESRSERRELIPILLDEIERCRPFFIGILGERYGWTPDREDLPFLDHPDYRWIEDLLEQREMCSVTELEIRHGVLNRPKRARHAFLYFRDPSTVTGLPEAENPLFLEVPRPEETAELGIEEATARAGKRSRCLADLKEEIRRSARQHHFGLTENYRSPEELGRLIESDFLAALDELFPDRGYRVVTDPLAREAGEHRRFAASRTGVYIAREAYFQELDDHLGGYSHPLVIIGESGSGKSALLANWLKERNRIEPIGRNGEKASLWKRVSHRLLESPRKTGPGEFFLYHFIGATPQSTDWSAMLTRIMGELKRHFHLPLELPATRQQQRIEFPEWLERCSEKGRIVLLIDALNQLDDREGARELLWLPKRLPENVRLIVSTLPGPAFDEVRRRGWHTLLIEPLGRAERRQMAKEYLRRFGKELGERQIEQIVDPSPGREDARTSNPLFLKALLDELRHCRFETIDSRLADYLRAESIPDLFQRILERFEGDYDTPEFPHLVRDSFTSIWASRRGLPEHELLLLLGDGSSPMPRHHWSFLFNAARESFVDRAGMITFFHQGLREAVARKYLTGEKERRNAHLRLAGFYERDGFEERTLDEFPWQLTRAGSWRRLSALLATPEFFLPAYRANPRDLRYFWSEIEQHGGIRMVDCYRPVIEEPAIHAPMVPGLASLLSDMGKMHEAGRLRRFLLDDARRTGGDDFELIDALLDEAYQLRLDHKLGEAMERLEEASEVLAPYGDDPRLADCLNGRAIILTSRGEYAEAIDILKRQRDVAERTGNRASLLRALGNRAYIHGQLGELDEQIALLDQAEQLARQIESWSDLATTWHNRAIIALIREDYDGAMKFARAHEELCRDKNIPTDTVLAIRFQGEILEKQGRDEEALACYRRAAEEDRLMSNPLQRIDLITRQCRILNRREAFDEVERLQDEKIEILRGVNNPRDLVRALTDQAVLLIDHRNNIEKAGRLLEDLIESIASPGEDSLRLPCLIALAGIDRQLHRVDDAVARLEEARLLAEEREDTESLREIFESGYELFREEKDFERAFLFLRELETATEEGGADDDHQAAIGNQGLLLLEMDRPDEALEAFRRQEKVCRVKGDLPHGLQWSLFRQAALLDQLGDTETALERSGERIAICRGAGLRDDLPRALQDHAQRLDRTGQWEDALEIYRAESDLHRNAGDAASLQLSLCDRGNILYRQESHEKALALYTEQEAICRENDLLPGLRISLFNQYLIREKQGNHERALSLLEEEESVCREIEQEENLALNLFHQASLLQRLDRDDDSLSLLETLEKLCRESGLTGLLRDGLLETARLLESKGRVEEAEAAFRSLEEEARAAGDPDHLQVALAGLAGLHRSAGDFEGAFALLEERERICRDESYYDALQGCLCDRGNLFLDQDRLEEALDCYRAQEELCRRHRLLPGLRISLHNQQLVLRRKERLGEALELAMEEEELCRELGLTRELENNIHLQGVLHHQLGKTEEALAAYRKVEELAREAGSSGSMKNSLLNQAIALKDLGEIDSARENLDQSIDLCRRTADLATLRKHLASRAALEEQAGDGGGALRFFAEEEAVCLELEERESLQICLFNQGRIHRALGDARTALEKFRELEEHGRTHHLPGGLASALGAIAEIEMENGNLEESQAALEEQIVICRSRGLTRELALALRVKGVFRYRQQKLNDALTMLEEAEEAARNIDDPPVLALVLGNKSSVLQELGEADAALSSLREAESLQESAGNWKGVLDSIAGQIRIHSASDDLEAGLEAAERYEELGHSHPEAEADLKGILVDRGNLLGRLGRYDEALATHRREEELWRRENDPGGVAGAIINQGVALESLERREEANDCYVRAESLSRKAENRTLLEVALYNRGCYLQFTGKFEDALLCFGESEALARTTGNDEALHRSLIRQNEVYLMLGDPEAALRTARESGQAAIRNGDFAGQGDALLSQGRCHTENGNHEEALGLYEQAEKVYRDHDIPLGIHLAEIDRADALHRIGRTEEALLLSRAAEIYFTGNGDKRLLSAAIGNQARIHAARGDESRARDLHGRELRLARDSEDSEVLVASLFDIAESHIKNFDDREAAEQYLAEGLEIARKKGFVAWEKKLADLGKR